MKIITTLLAVFVSLCVNLTHAQYASSTMDLLVAYQFSKSTSVAFIEGHTGKLVSKATATEPIFFASIDSGQDIFYLQSRHSIFKGNITTGQILEKQRVYEEEEKIGIVDYNRFIQPLGINNKGIAIWSYDMELTQIMKEIASNTDQNKYAELMNQQYELAMAPTVYKQYDFTSKEISTYGPTDKYLIALQSDDNIWLMNRTEGTIVLENRVTKKEISSYDAIAPLKSHPILQNYIGMGIPTIIGGDLFALTFPIPNKNITAICNNKTGEIITTYNSSISDIHSYPLILIDSDSNIYGRIERTLNVPEPQIPKISYSKDKIITSRDENSSVFDQKEHDEYKVKLDAYKSRYAIWAENRNSPELNNILLFSNKNMEEEPILVIKGALHAQIYNNTNALVINNNNIVMYDINTASKKWTVNY